MLKSPTCQRYERTSAPLQHGAVPSPWGVAEAPRRPPAARTYVRHDVTALVRVRAGGTWRRSMAERRAVPSDLFPFVLAFLRENRFEGAARAFAKEAAAVSGAGAGEGSGERHVARVPCACG